MDLIKSGSYTDNFYAKTCNNKNKHDGGVSCSACNAFISNIKVKVHSHRGARWLSGRVSDSGARGPGFETYRRRVVSLSKTLYSPKVLVNYPGSDGSVPI